MDDQDTNGTDAELTVPAATCAGDHARPYIVRRQMRVLANTRCGPASRWRWALERYNGPRRVQGADVEPLTRITLNPDVMGGKPCIRGLRVTVGTVVGLVATGYSTADILQAYPYLEEADIAEALAYAAWRAEEVDVPLAPVS